MLYRILAECVVLLHFAFVLFVILGGLLACRWPRVAFAHVPAFIWGALIEFRGWICPLTPLENLLRRQAGDVGYAAGFIEHYIVRIIYPSGLTRTHQIILGVVVVVLNLVVYAIVLLRRRGHAKGARSP